MRHCTREIWRSVSCNQNSKKEEWGDTWSMGKVNENVSRHVRVCVADAKTNSKENKRDETEGEKKTTRGQFVHFSFYLFWIMDARDGRDKWRESALTLTTAPSRWEIAATRARTTRSVSLSFYARLRTTDTLDWIIGRRKIFPSSGFLSRERIEREKRYRQGKNPINRDRKISQGER